MSTASGKSSGSVAWDDPVASHDKTAVDDSNASVDAMKLRFVPRTIIMSSLLLSQRKTRKVCFSGLSLNLCHNIICVFASLGVRHDGEEGDVSLRRIFVSHHQCVIATFRREKTE